MYQLWVVGYSFDLLLLLTPKEKKDQIGSSCVPLCGTEEQQKQELVVHQLSWRSHAESQLNALFRNLNIFNIFIHNNSQMDACSNLRWLYCWIIFFCLEYFPFLTISALEFLFFSSSFSSLESHYKGGVRFPPHYVWGACCDLAAHWQFDMTVITWISFNLWFSLNKHHLFYSSFICHYYAFTLDLFQPC